MAKDPRILDVCEPIFLYICELSRLRREGVPGESAAFRFAGVRRRVEGLLASCQEVAGASNRLQDQWNVIEKPLCCFLDAMIEEILGSRNGEDPLACATEWANQRLADIKFSIVTGDDAFFEFMEEELSRRDTDGDARERLEFYHACMALGFTGKFRDDPEGLDNCRQRVAGRIQHLLKKGPNEQYTPLAYDNVNAARLNLEPQPVLWGVAILTFTVVAFFFIATAWLYRDSSRNLETAIKGITDYGKATDGLH